MISPTYNKLSGRLKRFRKSNRDEPQREGDKTHGIWRKNIKILLSAKFVGSTDITKGFTKSNKKETKEIFLSKQRNEGAFNQEGIILTPPSGSQ